MDIALVADKGGVGKTTLAYHLATRFRQLGRDVALIDLDHRGASSSWVREAEHPYFPAYRYADLTGGPPHHAVRVWDTPAHPNHDILRHLAEACDVILIVSEPDLESQRAAADVWLQLSRFGCDRVRVVFNSVAPTGQEGALGIEAAHEAGVPCLRATVRRYQAYQHCRWRAQAVCDYPYPSADKAWADICAVADEVSELAEVHHVVA